MPENKLSWPLRFALWLEYILMARLLPANGPGPLFKWLFKVPVLFYKIGLPLFGDFTLLLTTTGRKSGKPRQTPLEYRREEGSGYCLITAGWGGRTDWRRNLEANPRAHVQRGREHFEARAERLSDGEVSDWLALCLRLNPRSERIWSRWAGEPLAAQDRAALLRAAARFPTFRLVPLNERANNAAQ